MKIFHALLWVTCLIILGACGHSDTYRLTGTISDGSTQNMRVLCHSAGGVSTSITAALDGKFRFESPLKELSMVEVYDNDYRLMGRFIVKPGDDITMEIDRSNVFLTKVDGNDDSRQWSKFLNDNAGILASGSATERNALIERFVGENPDSRVAEMLLSTEFVVTGNEVRADSLYRLLDPALLETGLTTDFGETIGRLARGHCAKLGTVAFMKHGNTSGEFNPADAELNLLMLSSEKANRDSIREAAEELARIRGGRKIAILDLGLYQDTIQWSRETRRDSATWVQGWAGGGPSAATIESLAVPSLPYYILTDSTGTQLWRGASLPDARAEVMKRI